MSGHSHWSTIKHKKGAADAKRGQLFSKLSRIITIAAKEKGGDPATNSNLRMAIEKAKEFNLPKENVERAIKRGTGEIEGATLEEFMYEAYGPGGIALIIEGVTDNKNRTLGDIRGILSRYGGKLAESGTVKWMFERKGVIELATVNCKLPIDELELMAIETGAQDIKKHSDGTLDIFTKPEELEKVKSALKEKNIGVESGSLDWVATNPIGVSDESVRNQLEKLFEALDENDDVQEIYSNLAM